MTTSIEITTTSSENSENKCQDKEPRQRNQKSRIGGTPTGAGLTGSRFLVNENEVWLHNACKYYFMEQKKENRKEKKRKKRII